MVKAIGAYFASPKTVLQNTNSSNQYRLKQSSIQDTVSFTGDSKVIQEGRKVIEESKILKKEAYDVLNDVNKRVEDNNFICNDYYKKYNGVQAKCSAKFLDEDGKRLYDVYFNTNNENNCPVLITKHNPDKSSTSYRFNKEGKLHLITQKDDDKTVSWLYSKSSGKLRAKKEDYEYSSKPEIYQRLYGFNPKTEKLITYNMMDKNDIYEQDYISGKEDKDAMQLIIHSGLL